MSNRSLKVFLLLAVFLAARAASAQSKALLELVHAHDEKSLATAQAELAACRTASKKAPCPRFANLSLLTGMLLLSESRADEALKQLQSVPAPRGLEFFHGWYLAESFAWSGDAAGAVKRLQKLKNPPSWMQDRLSARLGELLLQAGKPKEALKVLGPVTTRSMSPELLFARAQAAARTGDVAGATSDYKLIAIRYPTHPHAAFAREALGPEALTALPADDQLTRVLALQSAGALNDTLAALDAFPEVTGKNAPTTKAKLALIRGQVLLLKGKDAEGFKQLDAAIASGIPTVVPDALNAKARRYMRLGQNADAQAAFRALESRYPQDPNADDAGYFASWLNLSSGDNLKAAAQFADFETTHPTSRKRDEARWFRGFSFYREKKFKDAREVLTSLASDFPRSPLVPQALYWATRAAQVMPAEDAGAPVDFAAEFRAVINGFPGSIYAWFARERLRDLKVDVGPIFPNHPKSLAVSIPEELGLAAALATTGLFHDASDETARVLSIVSADTALTWGHALQSLGDFGSAHTLAARYLWGQVYGSKTAEAVALMYPEAFADSVRKWSSENGVSPYFAWAIMRRESAFRPEVSSSADARGLMQIIPPTATAICKELKIDAVPADALFAPDTNVQLGTWYLSALLTRMGHLATAAGSYNAGPSAVSKWVTARGDLPLDQWIEEIPYKETRGYVKQVVADALIYEELYGEGAPALSMQVVAPKVNGVQF